MGMIRHFTDYDEVLGVAARSFAAFRASLVQRDKTGNSAGSIMWIPLERDRGVLSAAGLQRFIDLDRLTLVTALKHKEALWTAEQALRSGAVSLLILELSNPCTLTESRRLKLAVEAGNVKGSVGLLVILPSSVEASGSAAHTRWRVEPVIPRKGGRKAGSRHTVTFIQRWDLVKNKSGTMSSWEVSHHDGPDQQDIDGSTETGLSVVSLSGSGDPDTP